MKWRMVGRRPLVRSLGLAVLFCSTVAAYAQAQAVITGRVTDSGGNPIPGANVVIPSLGLVVGANTRVDGTYTINLPAPAAGRVVVVTARRIGFAPVTRQITVATGSQTENFQLSQDATRIDDIACLEAGSPNEWHRQWKRAAFYKLPRPRSGSSLRPFAGP